MPDRADRLPHVDEHSIEVDAGADATWESVLRVAEGTTASGSRAARLLGCADLEASGPRPLAVGSAFPGFHVEAAERPRELALVGSHRFSDYALIFRIDDLGDSRSRLRAETRAEFPGQKGRVYRALVIGTRGHVLAVRRMLGAAKRRAERLPTS
ncbi:MAG TPA: hypothetical protein VFT10_08705 [Solirubrobacterales bacterium]|nr:hypothetical protein [Solirubrobacterales bacterium]